MRRFPNRYIDSIKTSDGRVLRSNCEMPFGRTFVIALPAVLFSHFMSFAAISPTSPALAWRKRLVARVKSVIR